MRVLGVRVTGPNRLWLAFSDGFHGEVDLPISEGDPLIAVFGEARCNGLTVEWPGGIDYCPDTLRQWCESAYRESEGAKSGKEVFTADSRRFPQIF